MTRLFYVMFGRYHQIAPRIYKQKASIDTHIHYDPNILYQSFSNEADAQSRTKELTTKYSEVMMLLRNTKKDNGVLSNGKTEQTQCSSPPNKWDIPTNLPNIAKEYLQAPLFKMFSPSKPLTSVNYKSASLYFDGCSKNNPGPSSIGYWAMAEDNTELFQSGVFLSKTATNNQAELSAVAFGMMDCIHKDIKRIRVFGDSKLTVMALSNKLVMRATNLVPLLSVCRNLQKCFQEISYSFIPRSLNQKADKLANQALFNYQSSSNV